MVTAPPPHVPPLRNRLEQAALAFERARRDLGSPMQALQAMLEALVHSSPWRHAWALLPEPGTYLSPNPSGPSRDASPDTHFALGPRDAPPTCVVGTAPFPLEISSTSSLTSTELHASTGLWQNPQGFDCWFRLQPIVVNQMLLGWLICQTEITGDVAPPSQEAELLWAASEWLAQQWLHQQQEQERHAAELNQQRRNLERNNVKLPSNQRLQNYAQLVATVLNCERVVVVQVQGHRHSRLLAVSDSLSWDRRSAWCQELQQASVALAKAWPKSSHVACDSSVSSSSDSSDSPQPLSPVQLLPHQELGPRLPKSVAACVKVDLGTDCIWLWWSFSTRPFPETLSPWLSDFLIDTTLRVTTETQHHSWSLSLTQQIIPVLGRSLAQRLLIGLLGIVLLGLVPLPLRLVVQGELQPTDQRHLFAPENGRVTSVDLVDGQLVSAGTVLVTLTDDRLDEEWTELTGLLDSLQAEQRSLEARLASLSPFDAESVAETERLRSRAGLIEVQRRGLAARQEVLTRRRESMNIRAPIDGKVITAETRRRLEDRPLRRGEPLFVMANPEGCWEAHLKVDPLDWNELAEQIESRRRDQQTLMATLSINAFHQQSLRGIVGQFSGTPLFDAQGSMTGSLIVPVLEPVPANLPAGTRVVAWIECGRRPAAYVLFRRFMSWSRWHGWI